MQKWTIIFLALAALVLFTHCQRQEQTQSQPEITELEDMHHFIRPMWHDAYPAKDIEQLKLLYPDLEQQFQKLKDAPFPAEWPDKKMHWQQGVAEMGQTLDECIELSTEETQRHEILKGHTVARIVSEEALEKLLAVD